MAPERLPVHPKLRTVRDPNCESCRMANGVNDVRDVCVPGVGQANADVLVVVKNPLSGKRENELLAELESVGLERERIAITAAVKCRVWDQDPTKTDVKTCRPYLEEEVDVLRPEWMLALGNEPLLGLLGKSGVTNHRGATYDHPSGGKAFVSISPAAVARNPGQASGYHADLRYFADQVLGRAAERTGRVPEVREVRNKADLKLLLQALERATEIAFDVETNDSEEYRDHSVIACVAFTTWAPGDDDPEVWGLPLAHPESPFLRSWRRIVEILGRYLRYKRGVQYTGHNGKFDCRWLKQFGCNITQTFDTILAAHLLDENRPKGLKPLAQGELGATPWGVDARRIMDLPLSVALVYNGLDTYWTWRLMRHFKPQLEALPRKLRLFKTLMMPASRQLVIDERSGLWMDVPRTKERYKLSLKNLKRVEAELMEYVPEDWVELSGAKEINFNPSNFARWFLFDHLGWPVLERGKSKDDGTQGDPSMKEAVLLEMHARGEPVAEKLIERTKWYRYCNAFLGPYLEQVDEEGYIHSNFKLYGTVTGRLSSGKIDKEKITGRPQHRGVNLQQVPRDELIRGVFGAPPGWAFVEADYSQVELRIAAELAQERHMLHLYATGQDLHMAMAMKMTGKPASLVTKDERKSAKPVNFGFLYGMSWMKFIETAFLQYGIRFSEYEAQAARAAFFEMWPDLPRWHAKQRELVRKFGRVQSPLGRERLLPDIYSTNRQVQGEAERQAINSPVQSLASDMNLYSYVLVSKEMRKRGMRAHSVGMVHDATNYLVPEEELAEALPLIVTTMEQLPLEEKFGLVMKVPLVADVKVGNHWGGAREIPREEVFKWQAA